MKKSFTMRYEWSLESVERALNRHGINLALGASERSKIKLRIRKTNPATEGLGTVAIALVEKGTSLPLNWDTVEKVIDIIRREAIVTVFE